MFGTRRDFLILLLGAVTVTTYLPILSNYLTDDNDQYIKGNISQCAATCAVKTKKSNQSKKVHISVASDDTYKTLSMSDRIKQDILKRNPFEHFVAECSVDFLMTPKELNKYLQRTNPEEITCNPEVFRAYMTSHSRFYPGGTWIDEDDSWKDGPNDIRLYPAGCNFHEEFGDLAKCAQKNNWQKILITGDDNARGAYNKLINYIKARGMKCVLSEEAEANQTSRYLDVPNMKAPTTKLGCADCTHKRHACASGNVSMQIEYISTTRLWDKDISWDQLPTSSRPSSLQDFLLQHYFPDRGSPSVWIMLPTMHNENVDFYGMQQSFSELAQSTNTHLSTDSTVVLLSHPRFCHNVDPAFTMAYRDEHGISLNEAQHVANQLLFDAFRDQLILPDSKVLAFIDLMHVLCPFACHWNSGSTGLSDLFYKRLMEYVLMWMC